MTVSGKAESAFFRSDDAVVSQKEATIEKKESQLKTANVCVYDVCVMPT
jgi:hypothetical protein